MDEYLVKLLIGFLGVCVGALFVAFVISFAENISLKRFVVGDIVCFVRSTEDGSKQTKGVVYGIRGVWLWKTYAVLYGTESMEWISPSELVPFLPEIGVRHGS